MNGIVDFPADSVSRQGFHLIESFPTGVMRDQHAWTVDEGGKLTLRPRLQELKEQIKIPFQGGMPPIWTSFPQSGTRQYVSRVRLDFASIRTPKRLLPKAVILEIEEGKRTPVLLIRGDQEPAGQLKVIVSRTENQVFGRTYSGPITMPNGTKLHGLMIEAWLQQDEFVLISNGTGFEAHGTADSDYFARSELVLWLSRLRHLCCRNIGAEEIQLRR